MVSRELAAIVNRDFSNAPTGKDYLEHLNVLSRAS
jgi:hypothetical protein